MHPIVEISGLDYTGKTTQAEMLTFETQGLNVHNFGSFTSYGGTLPINLAPQELFQWWFVDSSFDEMSDALIDAYNVRKQAAVDAHLDLAVIERGQTMLRAQIVANFATRASVDIKDLVDQVDAKVNAGIANIGRPPQELLLITESSWQAYRDSFAAFTRTKVKESAHFTADQNEFYSKYIENTRLALGHYATNAAVDVVTVDGPAVDVQNTIRKQVIVDDICLPTLFPDDRLYLGFAGLSESGKSAVAARLAERHAYTRLKIGYFNESLKNTGQIRANPALMALHIVHFLATNRHISRATLESLHGPEVSSELKMLLGERWKTVYLELDEASRRQRLIDQFPGADPDELLRKQAYKDSIKLAAGVEAYKKTADVILTNSGEIDSTIAKLLTELQNV